MKVDKNSTISIGLAVIVAGAIATGSVTYGQMREEIKTLQKEQEEQSEIDKTVVEAIVDIDKKQAVLIEQAKEQKQYRRDTKEVLKSILEKLDAQ